MSQITTGQLFAEWQQMNQKLLTQIEKQDEIIAKQQALIDRFNSPIDTQLTGSIVELDVVELGTVSAGATVDVGVYDSGNLDGLLVWVSTRASGGRAGKFSFRFVHLSDSAHQDSHRNQIYTTPETLRSYDSDNATQIISKDYVSFKTDKMRVTVSNGAEEDSENVIAIVYGRLR